MAKRMTNQIQALKNLSSILTPDQRSALLSKLDRLGADGSNWWRRDWPERPMGRLTERLNLTEAQKTRAEVLFKAWEKPTEARREQIRKLNAEIVKRAFSPNPDSRRLEADAKKLAGLMVEGIYERSRQMEQFRSMLTDEQKRILDEGHMMRRPGKRVW
ncbi:MAG: periplasmic heavy metal sensor [Synergistaceae bacterium]|nr:periplasmic heavy metal sensor [Synergistaceae bacterium]